MTISLRNTFLSYWLPLILLTTLVPFPAHADQRSLRVVFLGDSLTAGFGLEVDEAYPALIQEKMNAAGIKAKIVNAGISGDTSAGGLRRIEWLLREPADVLIIALGGNDGLRGLDVDAMKKNLSSMIGLARMTCREMTIVLAGMLVPPNQGSDYSQRYAKVFSDVAKDETVELLPFLLEGVAGNPDLNQPDGVHPNVEGQKVIAEHVFKMLHPILEKHRDFRVVCAAPVKD